MPTLKFEDQQGGGGGGGDVTKLYVDTQDAKTLGDAKQYTDSKTAGKQDKLTAGNNITISGNSISATDTTYTAGNGLSLSNTEFSVDTTTIQPKLTAGENITIDANNEISAVDTKYSRFKGATIFAPGADGLVPGASMSNRHKFLRGTGGWETPETFVGTNGSSAGAAGFVPIPYTTDAGKFLKADATWGVPENTTYTAGNGLDLTNTEFSVDSNVVALQTDLPTNTSDLTNDGASGDSVYVEANELAAVATSGDYSDLLGAPDVNDATLTITQNGVNAGTFTANASSDVTIAVTDTTYNNFVGTDGASAGVAGLVPGPATTDAGTYLKADGTWATPPGTTYSAGTNIQINGTTISATDTTYTAGNGLSLNGTAFSVDTTTIQPKLTAGANIAIDGNNEISATDTTYNDFVGTDGVSAGTHGLVPAPATTDANAFLKGDGTWGTPPGTTYTAGANIQINGSTISATDTTYSDFGGATTLAAGSAGLVPAPTTADPDKFLKGDGTWSKTPEMVILSYGNSTWNDFISAYNRNAVVYCRASSNVNPGTGDQTRMAFMAYVNNATAPTEVEFQYVRSVSSKTSSQPVDQVFVYKLTSASGGTWTVATRDMAPKLASGTNANVSYSNGTYTVSATDTTYSDFVGTDGITDGDNGLVPAPITSDVDKYLKSDGTWATVASGGSTITLTNTDPGEGSPLAADNFIGVYGGVVFNGDYSLTEASTGTTWIDGKTIYKITVSCGTVPSAGTTTTDISSLNVDYIVGMTGIAANTSLGKYRPLPFVGESLTNMIRIDVDGNAVRVITPTGSTWNNYDAYVTLYYTKSV